MQIILVAVLLILVTGIPVFTFIKSKSPADPAVLFSLIFGVQMIAALLLLEEDIAGVYDGFFWLAAAIAAFSLGAVITGSRQRKLSAVIPDPRGKPRVACEAVYDSRTMQISMAVLLAASFTQPVSQIYTLGYSVKDLFSLRMLLEINRAAATNRYVTHSVTFSALTQAFLVLVYLAPLIGGWNFIYSRKKTMKILSLFTVTPSLLVLFTQNTKAAFIGSAFLFLSSLLAARIHKNGKFFKLEKRRGVLIVGLGALFIILNYLTFFLREGAVSYGLFCKVNYKMVSYLFGEVPAFNYWFSSNHPLWPHTFGLKTFYSVSDALGILKRVPGIYTDKMKTVHLNTNVYTAFRPLIDDFGAFGGVAVLFGLGSLSGFCFERLRAGRAVFLETAFVTSLYFYFLYAFITSPWAYISYTAAMVLFTLYLLLMNRYAAFRAARAGGQNGGSHAGV